MKLFKRTMAVLLSAAMIITAMSSGAFAASTTYTSDNYKAALTKTEAYTAAKLAKSAAGGEWLVLGLSRDDADIDNSLYDDYKYALLQEVKADAGVLSQRNYTVYAKTVLTWLMQSIKRKQQSGQPAQRMRTVRYTSPEGLS